MLVGLFATSTTLLSAQTITIGGNVYGGGSNGEVGTDATKSTENQTNVIIRAGEISGSVFGGGEKADVNGGTHVNLDGANASGNITIGKVYGGNDISGNVSGKAFVESTYKEGHKSIHVTTLFGGGNGDYDYSTESFTQGEDQVANPNYGLSAPDIANAKIQLLAGTFDQVFGGGNKATVTGSTLINLNNSTTVADGTFQFGSVFGGNNLVDMAIRPTWDLEKAIINNLYSGGNKGGMTYSNGILVAVTKPDVQVENVYGGCRMADVNPMNAGVAVESITAETIKDKNDADIYAFPEGYAARVYISDGKVTNVYGGNDVSGDVHFGTDVEIHGSVLGDVYGGGNGSYAYTDKDDTSDYYYAPGESSVDALNSFRPNVENVLLHVAGTEASPTYVGGSVYCGGNSATLRSFGGDVAAAQAKFNIGSYAVMNNVFLGSNGANMILPETIKQYADNDYSSLNLKDQTTFDKYMEGVEVGILPAVSFDEGYAGYSTKIGSLYGGGNVGSMSAAGTFTLNFLNSVVIYNKVVGGCNNANVYVEDPDNAGTYLTAEYKGGLKTGTDDATKVVLNISGMKLEPKTLNLTYNKTSKKFEAAIDWNKDSADRLLGGNIYGGCYASGYVKGGVEINITADAISDAIATANIDTKPNRDYVFSTALSAFGGGYGEETEITGQTKINIKEEGNILKAFGGGEMGVVDKDATINITSGSAGKLYGGGFEGLVKGSTVVYLDGGEVYDAIAGACNADVNGSAKMLLGSEGGRTHVLNNVYGGNDFGGAIKTAQTNSTKIQNADAEVTSNTYVLYKYGTVDGSIFGGACGNYDYSVDPYKTKAAEAGFTYPKFDTEVANAYNSFVDVASESNESTDIVSGNIFGGGCGYLDATGIVDMFNTYVNLRSLANRESRLVENVYGGGYYSVVKNTKVDGYSGNYGTIFGGTYGASADQTAATHITKANYSNVNTIVNTYQPLTANQNLTIYGAGGYAGATTTNVNLYDGKVGNVYGGSLHEGYCGTTNVNVLDGSKVSVAALFGGGKGDDKALPCDVNVTNVKFQSATAYVRSGIIYGGNDFAGASKTTNVYIDVPVLTAANGSYASIVGGGNGENTISGFTNVYLKNNATEEAEYTSAARVNNVYGGGRDGKVFNQYNILNDSSNKAYAYYKTNKNQNNENNLYANWFTETWDDNTKHTNVIIDEGVVINGNAYAGGYGAKADVCGNTYLKLDGGTITGDVYGGGYSGNVFHMGVAPYNTNEYGYWSQTEAAKFYANLDIVGGTVRNIFGGGLNGFIGERNSDNALADESNSKIMDETGNTRVYVGVKTKNSTEANALTLVHGKPAILRSVYGGGQNGAVYGKTDLNIYNGYVGYTYDGKKYVENLKLTETDANNILEQNGNVFAGGYGEGAIVMNSNLTLWDGKIRNSLYGGGEISAIGEGTVNVADGTISLKDDIQFPGQTHVHMYGGEVINDVFGGGRGYSYDLSGNMISGTKFYTDGYVFGTTDANIHRGKIGTVISMLEENGGHGNLFAGGNVGYVFAASKKNSTDGYYYDTSNNLTEDCRAEVSVCGIAKEAVTIDGTTFNEGDIVPTEYLNKLLLKDTETWNKIEQTGVTIKNAVFAGGNVTKGSDKVYAYATTIFGNATASVIDAFSRDLIEIGGSYIGGLYGDGNLTYVDGYRELNITNYGTDYYALAGSLDLTSTEKDADGNTPRERYEALTDRQRNFYSIKYNYVSGTAQDDYYNHIYVAGDAIMDEDYNEMLDAVDTDKTLTDEQKESTKAMIKSAWAPIATQIHEGRMLNTIQRADYCGINGSRMILKGAMDRAQDASEADFTNYTINRVGEISLNQRTVDGVNHGNYYGIYNVVKFLGALTSDVSFTETRTTTSNSLPADGKTYREFKDEYLATGNRNNASSVNKVALVSGVFLELVKELDAQGKKVYGPITGVVELDLMNVTPGEGGGYVYAKNVHGNVDSHYDSSKLKADILSKWNTGNITYKAWDYDAAIANEEHTKLQTSGNFVHPQKQIIDDCYPQTTGWKEDQFEAAHYWYIRGEFYVYDQLISAYTGSSTAYTATSVIPLTMTAQPNARIQLLNVLPGLYADPNLTDTLTISYEGQEKTYAADDPISYWDWYMANKAVKNKFKLLTYCCTRDVEIDGVQYTREQGVTVEEYNSLAGKVFYEDDDPDTPVPAQSAFAVSNAMDKDHGFTLTFDISNPVIWDEYKTNKTDYTDQLNKTVYNRGIKENTIQAEDYVSSATYRCLEENVYGQFSYKKDDIISKAIYDLQTTEKMTWLNSHTDSLAAQAAFESAYVATVPVVVNGIEVQAGYTVSATDYAKLGDAQSSFEQAYVCVTTVPVSASQYIVRNQVIGKTQVEGYSDKIQECFLPAYYCTKDGSWGGSIFNKNQNYNALEYADVWPSERSKFEFNEDALNVLYTDYDPYKDFTTLYNYATSKGTSLNPLVSEYADRFYGVKSLDYKATFNGEAKDRFTFVDVADGGKEFSMETEEDTLSNTQYEKLPNERRHFVSFTVADGQTVVYLVNETFDVGGVMYTAGKILTEDEYEALGANKSYVAVIPVGENTNFPAPSTSSLKELNTYYYCVDEFTLGEKKESVKDFNPSHTITNLLNGTHITVGGTVDKGVIVSDVDMGLLPDYQSRFAVSGRSPSELATLYVTRSANIRELLKDRYITLIYQYTYDEPDASGLKYDTRVEKHIVNLKVEFEAGTPTIGKIKEPELVLPLETVGFDAPYVEEGAFPVLGGGWTIFPDETSAKAHREGRGRAYKQGAEEMFWYQDKYYVAYYALTDLGKTYSDPVPVHVANYQRLEDVLERDDHMYISHPDVKRNPKIYIDSHEVADGKNELDYLPELFQMSLNGGLNLPTSGANTVVDNLKNLEFFIQSDIDQTGKTWTPVGNETDGCFMGNLHGNGYTLSGMSASLFGKLCGNVYNLGVTGTFTAGGIANTGEGRVENCWVSTTGTPNGKAVYAEPDADAHVINSYYLEKDMTKKAFTDGLATPRSEGDFVNGLVAYDLNRFYLEARYRRNNAKAEGTVENVMYNRLSDGTIETHVVKDVIEGEEVDVIENVPYTVKYPADYAWHLGATSATISNKYGYVEKYYEDGDFRYAQGLKPTTNDLRYSNGIFAPIYPDDYIIFGQKLSYGLYDYAHDTYPRAAVKEVTELGADGNVDNSKNGLLTDDKETTNRIYRAPAYYMDGTLGKSVVFNMTAAFADKYQNKDVHHNLTAIDFTGGNNDVDGGYTDKYLPLLDFLRIDDIKTSGLTKNLLAYTPASDTETTKVITDYFNDPDVKFTDAKYNTIAVQETSGIHGHVVQKEGKTYIAHTSHFFVDKENFNAPIAYTIDTDHNAWYQRTPNNETVGGKYANGTSGWETICLPFTADLVTTQTKGEITHFYGDSNYGHEYWLREFSGVNNTEVDNVLEVTFARPAAGSNDITVGNTYLYDHYYSDSEFNDKNGDDYYKYSGYEDARKYSDYPYYNAETPYLIGFPDATYYEFDLSGQFVPQNTVNSIVALPAQVMTFVSNTRGGGTSIAASDEMVKEDGRYQTVGGYVLTGYLQKDEIPANDYVLNAAGSSFDKIDVAQEAVPFRSYFNKAKSSDAKETRRLVIGHDSDSKGEFDADKKADLEHTIRIYVQDRNLVVESSYETDLNIYYVSGQFIKRIHVETGTNTYDGFRPGFYLVGKQKVHFKPGNY